jgi:hypothetical protein
MKVKDVDADRHILFWHIQDMVDAQLEFWEAMREIENLFFGTELELEKFSGSWAAGAGVCLPSDRRSDVLKTFYEDFGDVEVSDTIVK